VGELESTLSVAAGFGAPDVPDGAGGFVILSAFDPQPVANRITDIIPVR
jgi:hypothetical protein